MPKNKYFTQGSYAPEKDLLMKLSQEVINIHGVEINWILNPYSNVDEIYKEDRMPDLGAAKTICVYLKNSFDGVDGNALYSKFGFLNQQQVTLDISVKEWQEVFPDQFRPMEGDIFYMPYKDEFGPADFFKVTFIDREDSVGYFPLGKHHVFSITAEKWAYSSEDFSNTGVSEIDEQLPDWTNDISINPNLEGSKWKVNDEVQDISDAVVSWDETNPFGRS